MNGQTVGAPQLSKPTENFSCYVRQMQLIHVEAFCFVNNMRQN